MNEKIGFIGLGIMGKPMARNLMKAGYKLVVYDINKPAVAEIVADGAEEGLSPEDVASKSSVVITMLPNSPHVKDVVLGAEGVLAGARPGTVLIDMSSIAPLVSKELSVKAAEKKVDMLDAPVSGGEPKAVDGTLSIMVGGSADAFGRVENILKTMGKSVVHVGDIGSGNTTKLANQIIVALNIAALSEAMVLGTKAGVDPEKIYRAIRGGLAGSTVMDAKMPMILERNFKPGFRMELHIKDLMNALDTAREMGVPLPLTSHIAEIMQNLKDQDMGGEDHCGIVKFYEKLAQTEVKKMDT